MEKEVIIMVGLIKGIRGIVIWWEGGRRGLFVCWRFNLMGGHYRYTK